MENLHRPVLCMNSNATLGYLPLQVRGRHEKFKSFYPSCICQRQKESWDQTERLEYPFLRPAWRTGDQNVQQIEPDVPPSWKLCPSSLPSWWLRCGEHSWTFPKPSTETIPQIQTEEQYGNPWRILWTCYPLILPGWCHNTLSNRLTKAVKQSSPPKVPVTKEALDFGGFWFVSQG